MACLEAQAQVIAHGLTSAAAIQFFDELPTPAALMPPLEIASVEEMLQNRKADRNARYLASSD